MKTSQQWHDILNAKYPNFFVIDPDGWDRKNYQWSWHEQLITHSEFERRLGTSTVCMPFDMLKDSYNWWKE